MAFTAASLPISPLPCVAVLCRVFVCACVDVCACVRSQVMEAQMLEEMERQKQEQEEEEKRKKVSPL